MQTPTLLVGKSFRTYEELSRFIADYESHYRQKFYKRSSRKIASATNVRRHINRELVYYELNYSCVYGGDRFKSRSRGLRKSITSKLESPCSAYIIFRAALNGQTLEIRSFSDSHNHNSAHQNRWSVHQIEILIELYKKYPSLYNPQHPQYNDVQLRDFCLGEIVEILKPERPEVTEADVASQWKNLTTKWKRQEPQVWYLQKLEFLRDSAEAPESEIDAESQKWDLASNFCVKEEIQDTLLMATQEEDDDAENGADLGQARSSKDENEIFGEFVTSQLKKIIDDDARRDAFFEIHRILHQALKRQ